MINGLFCFRIEFKDLDVVGVFVNKHGIDVLTATKKAMNLKGFGYCNKRRTISKIWISNLRFRSFFLHPLVLFNGRDFLAVVKTGVDLIAKQ